ncbi:hypothetical protein F4778DRAFT_370563 [Xylariomycetidae sp. FL2044]|nr:hypothetical protein F4778DRAFT_370563 [Xylariomycetidae sp. FL2044]
MAWHDMVASSWPWIKWLCGVFINRRAKVRSVSLLTGIRIALARYFGSVRLIDNLSPVTSTLHLVRVFIITIPSSFLHLRSSGGSEDSTIRTTRLTSTEGGYPD